MLCGKAGAETTAAHWGLVRHSGKWEEGVGIGTGTGKGAPVGHLCATAAPVVGAVLLVMFPMPGTAQSCRENQIIHWMSRSASTKARGERNRGRGKVKLHAHELL